MKNILKCKKREIFLKKLITRYKILKEKVRDIQPMIEDVENVERNSSEKIESPGMYIYMLNTSVLLKLYVFINLVIY